MLNCLVYHMRIFWLVLFLLSVPAQAQRIYSYVNAEGVRVLTNLGTDRSGLPATEANSLPGGSSHNFFPLIQEAARDYSINEDLIQAIIRVESNFDPDAVSHKNCKGLMQLHPDTAARFGVKNIFDPAENIRGGVEYLSYLIELFNSDLDLVLAAYNAGENAVKRYQGIPPYQETISYVKKVRSLFKDDLERSPEAPTRRANRKIFRIVQEDGSVLFTNAPVG